MWWVIRLYNSDIWSHIWLIQKSKNTFINFTVLEGKSTSKSKTVKDIYKVDYCDLSIL